MSINLSSLDFWLQPRDEREAGFKQLRDDDPLSWQPQPETTLMPPGEGSGGYWAAVRYDDIRSVSRDAEHFISGRGVMLEDVPQEVVDAAQSFLAMDGAQHRSLRALVQAGFSPRTVRHLEDGVRGDVDTILDGLGDHDTRRLRRARRQAAAADDDHAHARGARGGPRAARPPGRLHGLLERPRLRRRPRADRRARRGDHDPARRLPRALRGAPARARGGPAQLARAGRGRRRAPDRRADRVVLRAAVGGRERHDAAHDLARDDRADRAPRPARAAGRGRRRAASTRRSRSSSAGRRR